MKWRLFLTVLTLLFSQMALAEADEAVMKRGRDLTQSFQAGEADVVWAQMSEPMQGAMKSVDALKAFREQVSAQLGREKSVEKETVSEESGAKVYQRYSTFDKAPVAILTQWVMDDAGRVIGFFIRPAQTKPLEAAPSAYLDRTTITPLRLPFADEFFVFWGGRTLEQNYHAAYPNQRFAYDLVIKRDGGTHANAGKENVDYYCFGAPILAPAAGKVIEAIDQVPDNIPGEMNAEQITGNRVIIDHGNEEYSMLAHLKLGSVAVKVGQEVRAGALLGQCGNSGNSSEAHLHYQLQDGPTFGQSAGLPSQFVDYYANGKPVMRGEPVRGQSIRPADR